MYLKYNRLDDTLKIVQIVFRLLTINVFPQQMSHVMFFVQH